MRRGTTPRVRYRIPNTSLVGWDVYMTFSQGGRNIVTIHPPEVVQDEDGCVVLGQLTQEETLKFRRGKASVQVRAYKDGEAIASYTSEFTVEEILLDGVIPKEVNR